MFTSTMSLPSLSEEVSVSSVLRVGLQDLNPTFSLISPQQQHTTKRKRGLPGNPDPDAEVIALSPKSLLATNRFVCEICSKGFQRDQNLQLHRRGHNLPWKLKQRSGTETRKKVYVCPENMCVHHHPTRALSDLTGIKKHFCRKHGEKKWKCEKCSKRYAVQSDWKAHSKTCGTRDYKCDCGNLFSRKDSFITHRAFCDVLAEETARLCSTYSSTTTTTTNLTPYPTEPTNNSLNLHTQQQNPSPLLFPFSWVPVPSTASNQIQMRPDMHLHHLPNITHPFFHQTNTNTAVSSQMSATALLQKAANAGAAAISSSSQSHTVGHIVSSTMRTISNVDNLATWHKSEGLTRDFLGLEGECEDIGVDVNANLGHLLFSRSAGFGFAKEA